MGNSTLVVFQLVVGVCVWVMVAIAMLVNFNIFEIESVALGIAKSPKWLAILGSTLKKFPNYLRKNYHWHHPWH